MSEPIRAYVAFGSNLGDRVGHLVAARNALVESESVEFVAASRIWETEPVGPAGQGAYLNAAIALDVWLSPRKLLELLLAIEHRSGRDRDREPVRSSPRVLDLDLLLYGDLTLDESDLEIPHPRLHERSFVLEPLCEIAGGCVHPRLGGTLSEHLARCRTPATARPWLVGSAWVASVGSVCVAEKIET
jgi:2-amino-4-hydroxy-6-hydroxymethyldihydropteridine diphosphokinase